jgi:signal peptidase I
MGDHRSVSFDSRGHQQDPGNGTVPEDRVVGRAFVIVAPISRWRELPIPATFEQPQLARAAALAPRGPTPAGRAAPPALTGLMAPAVPLGLGLTGAFPLTLLRLRLRRRRLAGSPRRAQLRRGRLRGHRPGRVRPVRRGPGRGRPGPG